MISIYKLKPKFQKLLHPLLVFLHTKGITANQITISAIILSFFIGILFFFADHNHLFFLALPIGLLIRMALNALDGMMARTYQQQSKKGEVLNELGDVVSDLFIFLPLLKFAPERYCLVTIFIAMSIINEFAGILSKAVSGERRYEGPMGKSDRALMMGVYGILCFLEINLHPYLFFSLIIIILLLIISTYTRISKSLK